MYLLTCDKKPLCWTKALKKRVTYVRPGLCVHVYTYVGGESYRAPWEQVVGSYMYTLTCYM